MVIGSGQPDESDLGGRFTGIERSGPAEPSGHDASGDQFTAHDTALDRDVRVVVRVPASSASRDAAYLARERALAALHLPALPGPLGLIDHRDVVYVVFPGDPAEPPATLADRLRRGPLSPVAAAQLVAELARAVAAAHRSGVTLGGLCAERITFSSGPSGRITAADPPGAAIEQDVAGLGAVLYAALTSHDPAAAGRFGGAEPKLRTPRELDPDLPTGLSTLTMRALQAGTGRGGIRSATTLASVLEEWILEQRATSAPQPAGTDGPSRTRPAESESPSPHSTGSDGVGSIRGTPAADHDAQEPASAAAMIAQPATPDGRRHRAAWTAAAAVVLGLAGIGLIALLISRLVTAVPKQASPRPRAGPVVTGSPRPSAHPTTSPSPSARPTTSSRSTRSAPSTATRTRASPTPPPNTAIGPISVSGFDPYYRPPGTENPDEAGLAADKNPNTAWYTLDYRKSRTFGNLKPGSGLRFDLGASDTLTQVTVITPTPGINFSVLTAETAAPQPSGYRAVGSVDDAGPHVTLPLPPKTRARYVVVWLTALAPHGGGTYRGGIAGVQFRGHRH